MSHPAAVLRSFRARRDGAPISPVVAALAALAALAWFPSAVPADATGSSGHAAYAAPLDGRTFRARIVRATEEVSEEGDSIGDELQFDDGMFSSAVCRRYDFTRAPYWVRVEGGRVHFLTELTSPTNGTMRWKGTITGDTLEGTMRWTKKRWYWTIDTEHRIRGMLDKAAAGPGAAPD